MNNEIFKSIPDYNGLYEISTLGNIKSFKRDNIGSKIKPCIGSNGYYYVNIYFLGKRNNIPVHHLMAITFLNHTPNGYKLVIDHINNNPLDNKLSNLQLITQRENTIKDKKTKK